MLLPRFEEEEGEDKATQWDGDDSWGDDSWGEWTGSDLDSDSWHRRDDQAGNPSMGDDDSAVVEGGGDPKVGDTIDMLNFPDARLSVDGATCRIVVQCGDELQCDLCDDGNCIHLCDELAWIHVCVCACIHACECSYARADVCASVFAFMWPLVCERVSA